MLYGVNYKKLNKPFTYAECGESVQLMYIERLWDDCSCCFFYDADMCSLVACDASDRPDGKNTILVETSTGSNGWLR